MIPFQSFSLRGVEEAGGWGGGGEREKYENNGGACPAWIQNSILLRLQKCKITTVRVLRRTNMAEMLRCLKLVRFRDENIFDPHPSNDILELSRCLLN